MDIRPLGIMLATLFIGLPTGPASAAEPVDPRAYLEGDSPNLPAPPRIPAGHGGIVSNGPNCGVFAYGPDKGPIWLGHFTGGNVRPGGLENGRIDWQDIYACFRSRDVCQAWQRDMRASYRAIEGYRACIVIR